MTQSSFPRTNSLLVVGGCAAVGLLLLAIGCQDRESRPGPRAGSRVSRDQDNDFLGEALADGLNHLPREIVLDLQPPTPILDDAKSANGQPVLATLGVTPGVADSPFNYLSVPAGNANFRKVGVRPGDIVRYFIAVDQDSVEHGIEKVNSIELTVRRLDTVNNPDNALIIEGGLSGPVPFPERIEIWRFSDKRMNEIRQRITRYFKRPKTLIAWEPSPDESALIQLHERANQWLRNSKSEAPWEPEPLVSELPAELRAAKPLAGLLSPEGLRSGPFDLTEMRQLQQAIWMRDIARWARQEAVSPVEVATALFDWTVRNVQLDKPEALPSIFQPWQALMYGHGTAEMRAWVFAELCRQQHLDVVMLATGETWWLPALLHDGQLYLFDARLGLPIAGPKTGSVATLGEVVEDPTLLSALDVNDALTYPTTAADLADVTAWLVASPLQLARRAVLLEQAFEGENYVALSAGTQRIIEQLKSNKFIDGVQLWTFPFQSVLDELSMTPVQRLEAAQRFLVFASRPRLWKARVLHFQGTKDIPLADRGDPLAQPDLGHRQATALYQDPRIRPPNVLLEKLDPTKREIYETAKGDASYWLGLLSYDLGKYRIAEDWFKQRTLAATPEGPWTAGARYNLARTYEAMGDLPKAIELLEADDSPQSYGNKLRAKQLKSSESEE